VYVAAVEAQIGAVWLLPQKILESALSDIDIARAPPGHDLKSRFGENDAGIPLILDLIDPWRGGGRE
jgi:hypothetical protein